LPRDCADLAAESYGVRADGRPMRAERHKPPDRVCVTARSAPVPRRTTKQRTHWTWKDRFVSSHGHAIGIGPGTMVEVGEQKADMDTGSRDKKRTKRSMTSSQTDYDAAMRNHRGLWRSLPVRTGGQRRARRASIGAPPSRGWRSRSLRSHVLSHPPRSGAADGQFQAEGNPGLRHSITCPNPKSEGTTTCRSSGHAMSKLLRPSGLERKVDRTDDQTSMNELRRKSRLSRVLRPSYAPLRARNKVASRLQKRQQCGSRYRTVCD